jgi:hypothetical protein
MPNYSSCFSLVGEPPNSYFFLWSIINKGGNHAPDSVEWNDRALGGGSFPGRKWA